MKLLRQKGCASVPPATDGRKPIKQEVVKIGLQKLVAPILGTEAISKSIPCFVSGLSEIPVIELFMPDVAIRIPQETDEGFLEQVLRSMRKTLC